MPVNTKQVIYKQNGQQVPFSPETDVESLVTSSSGTGNLLVTDGSGGVTISEKSTSSFYELPSGGIPESDLSSEVQSKLDNGGGGGMETLELEQESGTLTNAQITLAESDNCIIVYDNEYYYKNYLEGYDLEYVCNYLQNGNGEDGGVSQKTIFINTSDGSYGADSNGVSFPEQEVFCATYGATTYQEIKDAYDTNKYCFMLRDGNIYDLTSYNNNVLYFTRITADYSYTFYFSSSSQNPGSVSIKQLQYVGNKTTSLSSSSTDTQYPSAKCVYDYAQAISNKVNSFQSTPDDTHYPSEKLVKDSLDTKIDNTDVEDVDAVDVDSTPTQNSTNLVTSGGVYDFIPPSLYKYGVISQTQTWTQAADNGWDYTIDANSKVYGNIPQANIDLYEAAGATFNATSGYFELNGLTDISYEEMKAIYNNSIGAVPISLSRSAQFNNYAYRTNIPSKGTTSYSTNIGYWFDNSLVEVAALNGEMYVSTTTSMPYAFRAQKLKTIVGVLRLSPSTVGTPSNMFSNCYSLEEIRLNKLKVNLSFAESQRLSKDSLLYMINNAGTDNITITLHANVYAKTQSGGDWHSDISTALSSHTNVRLASA